MTMNNTTDVGSAAVWHGRSSISAKRPTLVGREQDQGAVMEHVLSSQVTTLVGPGGVGKTALAMAVAAKFSREDFPDGVAVVWLAPLRSADLVAAELAAAIGLTRSGGLSNEDAIIGWLADKDVLLVLDNCEHVVSAVADLVDSLTTRLPRLRILATSREPLWVDGELSHRLSPLPLAVPNASSEQICASPAVQLFRERAGSRQGDALKTEHANRIIAEICRRVDGLPLAIELAAARAAGLDLKDITSHLDDLFNLLPRPARRADGGQRSLRDTVEWSDALLSNEERRLLHRMAVFAGGFDLAAVNGICATEGHTPAQIADLTARLVEKSLLMKVGAGRYQMLETIRQHAIDKLSTAGEADLARDRHARFYLHAALSECVGLTTGPERPHIEVLSRIEDNLRVALARLIQIAPVAALELAAGLTIFWWTQGKLREGIGWLRQAREAATNAPPSLRAAGLFSEAFLIAHDTSDWTAAAKLLDVGIETIGSPTEPPAILGMLWCLRGECDVFNGDAKSGVFRTQTGLAMMSGFPDSWGQAFCLWNAAYARLCAGDEEAAINIFNEEMEISRRHGYGIAELCGCNVMGEIWEKRGNLEASRKFWERSLLLRQDLGASRIGYVHGSMPTALLAVARVAAKQGDPVLASTLLREALPIAEEMRDTDTIAEIRDLLHQTTGAGPPNDGTFRPQAGVWHIEFNGTSVHVPDFKGFWHIRELLARPRAPMPALSLVAAQSDAPLPIGDAGPQLDREALKQYRKRLAALDEALAEAETRHNVSRYDTCMTDRDALLAELSRATGLGGKPRRTGSPGEKARLNVTRTIRHAITFLATAVPELATHLDESLLTGVSCSYEPRVNVSWKT